MHPGAFFPFAKTWITACGDPITWGDATKIRHEVELPLLLANPELTSHEVIDL